MDQRVASMGAGDRCSGRATGGAMELYFLLGIDALPERRMLAKAVAAMLTSCGAMAVFQMRRWRQ